MRPDAVRLLRSVALLEAALTRRAATRRRLATEKKLQAAMARAFRAQGRAFVRELGAVRSTYPIQEAARWGDWLAKFEAAVNKTVQFFVGPIEAATTTAILLGARVVLNSIRADIGFDIENPRAVAWLAENPAAERVTMITETTREYIRGVVDRAVEEGANYNEMARRITERYEEMAVGKPQLHIDSRAHLIAVTEVGEAYSAGNLMAGQTLEDAGLPMEKAWDTTGDGRVSDGCAANAAAGWLPLANAFPSGHQRPLRFPGCRCDLLMRAIGADDDTTPTQRPAAAGGSP
jgi:hypothetical protein